MALRAHPAVIASIRGSLLLRLVRFASEPHRDFGLDRDLAQALALARARDLDPTARAHARVLALALARDLDPTARGLARDLARGLARGLARDLARDPTARGLARDLAFARDLALDRARDLDRARYLALLLDEPASRALGIQHMDGLGTALLDGALDDFTRADLSAADLVGVDLDGVRWSLWGTRWPPATDVERLKNQSRETRPGSGVFVVSGGTSTADLTRV